MCLTYFEKGLLRIRVAVDSLLLRKQLDQEQLVFSHYLTGWPTFALPASAVAAAAAFAVVRSVRWLEPLASATARLHSSKPSPAPSGEPSSTKTGRPHFILQAILIVELMATSLMRTLLVIS